MIKCTIKAIQVKVKVSEAYLKPSRTSTMDVLEKYLKAKSRQLFSLKSFIVGVRLGSKYPFFVFSKTKFRNVTNATA